MIRTSLTRVLLRAPAALLLFLAACTPESDLRQITVNYPTISGSSWPLFLAREGGYYEKHGLDVDLVFGVHPAGVAMIVSGEAQMTAYALEQAMVASSRDGSLVAAGSPFRKSLFALMAGDAFDEVSDLRGKRLGVSQLGDAPHNYTSAILGQFGITPREVEWIPAGAGANGRAAALAAGRVDATLLTAPAYYRLEEMGFRSLANFIDYEDIYAPTVYLFSKDTVVENPELPARLIKAHAEAIKRFYDDMDFAVDAYLVYDPEQERADIERMYASYAAANSFERVPYIPASAVEYVMAHPSDPELGPGLRQFDFHTVIDNGIVDELVREGFFEDVFGTSIAQEQASKRARAYGLD